MIAMLCAATLPPLLSLRSRADALDLLAHYLGERTQLVKPDLVEVAWPDVDDAERTDAVAVRQHHGMPGIEPHMRSVGDLGIVGETGVEPRVGDHHRLPVIDDMGAEALVARRLLHVEAIGRLE